MLQRKLSCSKIISKTAKKTKWITKSLKKVHIIRICYVRSGLKLKILKLKKIMQDIKIFKLLANQAESDYYKQLFDTRTNSIKQLWTNLNSSCACLLYTSDAADE